ncbi:MAG: tetratricopeptide repeat protein, partial [Tumebacillaceae bacterium]
AYLYSKNTLHDLKLFSELVRKYPYSRHAHSGYSNALYEQYVRTGDLQYAKHALNEMVTASRIGYSFHRIHYLEGIKRLALETKEPEIAIQWFKELLSKNPNLWEVNLQYAKLLEALDDPKAIRYFRTAMKVRPEGNSDAHVYLAEYYINRGKYDDALQITLPKEERAFYLDFLHGFALEKLGRGSEAIPLYQKYQSMSQSFPVPSKYRIPGSPFQQGIHFQ